MGCSPLWLATSTEAPCDFVAAEGGCGAEIGGFVNGGRFAATASANQRWSRMRRIGLTSPTGMACDPVAGYVRVPASSAALSGGGWTPCDRRNEIASQRTASISTPL